MRVECLAAALAEETGAGFVYGIRGGLTALERRELLQGGGTIAVAPAPPRRKPGPVRGWSSYKIAAPPPLEGWTPAELTAARASTST